MAFPDSFQNQTQQNELQKECCCRGKSGDEPDNPKLPQTGKTTIIHVAPRHSIFGKFLGKERSVYSLFFSETRMVDTFAGILYFPKNSMIFPKTAIFGNFFDF
ncbi:hypothetical protein DWX08_11525 [Ruminococcus sp. AF18-22]|jgi:hypothetical protein|nr:hypothetical protein DWX08_11525 [Ruminococcus sp. AF18-22]